MSIQAKLSVMGNATCCHGSKGNDDGAFAEAATGLDVDQAQAVEALAAAANQPDLKHHDPVFVRSARGGLQRALTHVTHETKVFSEWYEVVKHLGAGAFGDVMLVKSKKDDPANPKVKKGQSAACKVINDWISSAEDAQDQLAEARLLRSIEHPNIVGFREYFVSSSGGEEVDRTCVPGD